MKDFRNFIVIILSVIMFIYEAVEFLTIPALLVFIGIINDFGYLY